LIVRDGALPGVCTWMLFLPDEDLCVILLSNRSAGEPRCGQVALEIARLALAEDEPSSPAADPQFVAAPQGSTI